MEFVERLKMSQLELGMNSTQFAKYMGMSRAWLIDVRSNTKPSRTLQPMTMIKIHKILGIPLEVMEKYNKMVVRNVLAEWEYNERN